MKNTQWLNSKSRLNSLVIVLFLLCGFFQFLPTAAQAAISTWSVTDSQANFSGDTPTWSVTISTNDSGSALTSGDIATFIIEDVSGQGLGSLDQEITANTTRVTFNISLDPATASSDVMETDFLGTFMITHPVEDDEILEMPLTKAAQAADWRLSSSVLTTSSNPYVWTLKFNAASADSALGNGDSVELFISDADSNQLADETLTITKSNTTAFSIKISIDPATLTPSWSANSLDGMLIIQSASGNQQIVEFPAPITGLPNRPVTADDYVKSNTDYSNTAFVFQPVICTDVPVSAKVNDPYHDVANVLFTLIDGSGNTITQGADESVSNSTFSTSFSICPDDLKGLTSPFNLVLGLAFESTDREYSEVSTPFTWKLYVKPVVKATPTVAAKPKVVKITCVRAKPYSKITTTKAKCPTGYKKK